MARSGNNQRSANRVAVDVGATGTKPASRGAVIMLVVSVLAAVWAVAMMTKPGRVGYIYFYMYAEYYMGVLTLVSLSITIMVGLVATDRLVLSIRQRVLLQSTHRTTGLIAVTSLVAHVWTKIAESHIGVIDVFIPFLSQGNRLYVGFGTISGWVMILVMWTGIARSRFIGKGRPWMWRGIHAISYLIWPIALMHGLAAGRPAKAWVIVSYIVCILMVLVGLAVRFSVSLNRNKDFSSSAGIGGKPTGTMVPTSSPAKAPRRREREPEPERLGPVAVLDTFQPASSVMTAPPVAPPRDEERGRRYEEDLVAPAPRARRSMPEDEIDFDEPAPRGRRYAGEDTSTRMRRSDLEDTSTRMRRPEMDDTSTRMRRVEMDDTSTRMRRVEMDDTSTRMRRVEMDDTSGRMSRSDLEDTSTRMRRPEMDDTSTRMRRGEMDDTRSFRPDFDEPSGRQRRYAEEEDPRARRRPAEPEYDDAPRGRRRAEAAEYDNLPPQRGRYDDDPPSRRSTRFEPRFGGEAEDAPRARRDRGADLDRADSGRHSRTQFVDMANDQNYPEPDETPTLVDMASRRALRSAPQESVSGQAGRGARRNGRGRLNDEVADDAYWSQLRGEAN